VFFHGETNRAEAPQLADAMKLAEMCRPRKVVLSISIPSGTDSTSLRKRDGCGSGETSQRLTSAVGVLRGSDDNLLLILFLLSNCHLITNNESSSLLESGKAATIKTRSAVPLSFKIVSYNIGGAAAMISRTEQTPARTIGDRQRADTPRCRKSIDERNAPETVSRENNG
jgi:hypothetical protein